MRVTTNSMVGQYMTSLNDIAARQQKENVRLTSGNAMVDLSDNPSSIMSIQYYDQNIQRSSVYRDNASSAVNEMVNTEAMMEQFSNTLGQIRQTATDSLSVDNADKLPTLATNIRGLLQNMIDTANTNFNGMYSFAGTKTTASSLTPTPPETTNLPFELVQDTPTSTNPSGLRVSFKGNFEKRQTNIGPSSTEQINLTADDAFGPGGIDAFNKVVDVYNKMMYKPDGTKRSTISEPYSTTEQHDMQSALQGLGAGIDNVDRSTAIIGARQSRLQSIQDQLTEEITRTKDLRSSIADTDVGQTIMNLNKDQVAMQFALQAGTKLFGRTLMDFLG